MRTKRNERAGRGAIALLCLALLWALPAIAGPHGGGERPPGPPGGPPHMKGDPMTHFLERHADELGLDQATRDAIEQIVTASQERSRQLDEARRDAHETLRTLLESDDVDRKAVMDQVEVMGALDLEQSRLRISTLMDVRAKLTPEQRAKLKTSMERRFDERHGAVLSACEADLAKHCAGSERGPGMVRCLFDHQDDLSDACSAALPQRGDKRDHHRHGHEGHEGHDTCGHGPDCDCKGRHDDA